jgi:hypothetical protein
MLEEVVVGGTYHNFAELLGVLEEALFRPLQYGALEPDIRPDLASIWGRARWHALTTQDLKSYPAKVKAKLADILRKFIFTLSNNLTSEMCVYLIDLLE